MMALRFSRNTAIREERTRKRLQRKGRIIRQIKEISKKNREGKLTDFVLHRVSALTR